MPRRLTRPLASLVAATGLAGTAVENAAGAAGTFGRQIPLPARVLSSALAHIKTGKLHTD